MAVVQRAFTQNQIKFMSFDEKDGVNKFKKDPEVCSYR